MVAAVDAEVSLVTDVRQAPSRYAGRGRQSGSDGTSLSPVSLGSVANSWLSACARAGTCNADARTLFR